MKNTKFFITGMLAMVLTCGLVLAGCGKKDNSGGGNAGGGVKGFTGILSTALSGTDESALAALVEALKSATPAMLAELNKKASPAGDFKYDLNKTGDGIVITGYTGGPILIVPSEIEGYPVVELAWGSDNIQILVLPEGLKKLNAENGRYGYSRDYRSYSNLRCVVFPSTLSEMVSADDYNGLVYGLFSSCWQLTSIDLSHTDLTKIPEQAFSSCSRLTDLKLPASIKTIGEGAFYGCGELYTIDIPDSVTAITFEKRYGIYGTFEGSGKLPLATRQRLKDLGYKGEF
jgi:hypothetical protein